MSCPSGPTNKEVELKCLGRGTGQDGLCIYNFWVLEETCTGNEDRCETCITIEGVKSALRNLVYREPWWETEGKAGEPQKEAWELAGSHQEYDDESDQCDADFGDGMTTRERDSFREKMGKHFLSTQGSGLTEDEALADDSSRPNSDSPTITLIGEEWGGEMNDGEKEEVEHQTIESQGPCQNTV